MTPSHDRTAAGGANDGASKPPTGGCRRPPALTREFILNTVSAVFDVDAMLLMQPERGKAPVALARQAAMYLAHVCCGLSLTAVGHLFERDRSTVAHACRRIEDAREKPQFDRVMTMMEQSIGTIIKTSPALRADIEALVAEGGR